MRRTWRTASRQTTVWISLYNRKGRRTGEPNIRLDTGVPGEPIQVAPPAMTRTKPATIPVTQGNTRNHDGREELTEDEQFQIAKDYSKVSYTKEEEDNKRHPSKMPRHEFEKTWAEGDKVFYNGETHTILEVKDSQNFQINGSPHPPIWINEHLIKSVRLSEFDVRFKGFGGLELMRDDSDQERRLATAFPCFVSSVAAGSQARAERMLPGDMITHVDERELTIHNAKAILDTLFEGEHTLKVCRKVVQKTFEVIEGRDLRIFPEPQYQDVAKALHGWLQKGDNVDVTQVAGEWIKVKEKGKLHAEGWMHTCGRGSIQEIISDGEDPNEVPPRAELPN